MYASNLDEGCWNDPQIGLCLNSFATTNTTTFGILGDDRGRGVTRLDQSRSAKQLNSLCFRSTVKARDHGVK